MKQFDKILSNWFYGQVVQDADTQVQKNSFDQTPWLDTRQTFGRRVSWSG